MDNIAELTLDGKTCKFPIIEGTEKELKDRNKGETPPK